MATWYVNSAATGTGAGTSWANACTTFALVLGTAIAAGDDVDVAYTHSESTASAITLTFPGTAANPNRIISCDTTNAPAQGSDVLAGAVVTTTGTSNITINGYLYCYGVTFNCGTSTGAPNILICNGYSQTFEACAFAIKATGNYAAIRIGSTGGQVLNSECRWINTTVSFGAASHQIQPTSTRWFWSDTISAIGGTALTGDLINNANSNANAFVATFTGVDLSGIANANLVYATTASIIQLRNCRLASSGALPGPGSQGEPTIDNIISDSSETGYRQERYWYQGTLTTSTSIYNNASDSVTPISWKVVTGSANKRYMPFECFEIIQWVGTGTYTTSTIQLTSATASLTNADVWVDVQVMASTNYPIASLVSSGPANQLTAGSGLAAGSWATGGQGNNYKIQIPSFTVAIAGYVRFVVKVGKATLTVYIDPDVNVAA